SYDLLEPSEQSVLAHLSTFAGGFALDAGEAVATHSQSDSLAVDDALVSLIDKSLVEYDNGRYRLLEPTREVAADRLAESGEAASANDAHWAWTLQFAHTARTELRGADESVWVDRVDREWPNIRAAFRRALATDDPTSAMTFSAELAIEIVLRRSDALDW